MDSPVTIDVPDPLPVVREKATWWLVSDGVRQKVSNLDKPYWGPEGYTKGDLLAYYFNVAPHLLPYLHDRPLTMKRMPEGADGDFFYAKQAPGHTPGWVATAPVTSLDTGKCIDYVLTQDRPTLLWLANLGCIELHPWHSRVDDIGHPDYAFFDLDPMGDAPFAMVREVALLVRTVLDQLGLRGYPRTSGATGMQIYVPIERVHSSAQVREWVGRVCTLINRADPERTTMQWQISDRGSQIFLDHGMNTEGKNIASVFSVRPERGAPVATPLTWEDVAGDVEPRDFTIASVWPELEQRAALFAPVLHAGQDLRAAMVRLGMDPDVDEGGPAHRVGEVAAPSPPAPAAAAEVATPAPDLAAYRDKRDFSRTPEPAPPSSAEADRHRFVLQHHLATRLHHDLRLERDGVAVSWALPRGLPDVPGVRHLAVQTEDHPVPYMTFEGEIPAGEYGGGPVRIWDAGTYTALEWVEGKVTFRLDGRRHHGEYHLFRTGAGRERDQWMVTRADDPRPDEVPPDPPRLAPMLATSRPEPFDDPGWLFEVKWDGVRAVAVVRRPGTGAEPVTTYTSRQGNDISAAYPEIAGLWERVLARNAVLDGEVVAFDAHGRPSFQRLQRRMHVRDTAALERLRRQVPVAFVVFDLLALDGEALVDQPLRERLAVLDEVFVPGGAYQRSEVVERDGVALYRAAQAQGLEGIMAKRATSRYQPGKRSRDWLKLKVRRTADFVVGGWMPGEGGRSGHLGSLLVGAHVDGRLRYAGRVGTGFDEAELNRLGALLDERSADRPPFEGGDLPRGARFVLPTLVCRVEYAEVTEDGILRAPAYKGLVDDADPLQVTFDEVAGRSG